MDLNFKNGVIPLVSFSLDGRKFALPLEAVERAVAAVEVTPLPGAPETVSGAVDFRGSVIPVFDIRKRFCLPSKEISLTDKFIIARTSKRQVAVVADDVSGLIECASRDFTPSEKITQELKHVKGVLRLPDGLILIHDLEDFLSSEEEFMLDESMKRLSDAENP